MKRVTVLILLPLLFIQLVSQEASTQVSAKKVTLEGTLEVRFDHFADGSASESYFLNTVEERYELLSTETIPRLSVGSHISVSGRMRNGKLRVETGAVVVESATTGPALGEQRQLVMLYNYQDNPNNKPWTSSVINDLVFNQVNTYWQTASYGQTWITGDLAGWYTIPVNSTDCSANTTQAAFDGARALGFNPDNYTHFIFIHPSTTCSPQGASTSVSIDSNGNRKTYVFVSGLGTFRTVGHEFGHSLGLFHSNALNCNGVTFGASCGLIGYGDHYDIMGYYPNTGAVNSYQRDLLQLMDTRIQTVASDGTYTLTPLGIADSNLKALRIPQSNDPTTNSTTYYYLEYRQPVGYDSFLSNYPGVTSGVLLHLGTISSDLNQLTRGAQLLDGTPTVTGANEALGVGQSYSDPAIPMTVTVLSANSSGATVYVQFSAPTCAPASPAVAITPSTNSPAAPGTSVPYTVTVSNNEGSSCSASSFNLQASVPSGWAASFTNQSLTINPGSSASTTLTVISSSSAGSGSYNIGATATSSSSAYFGSASATYNVATSLAVAVSTNRPSYNRKQSVTMSGVVSANGSPVQGASVSFTMTKSNGATVTLSATTGSSGSASVRFQLKKADPVGTYQGRGAASVNGVSGSAATSFTVQ